MGRLADWLSEIKEILEITIFNKWLWIIVGGAGAIIIFSFLIMTVLLTAPSWIAMIVTVLVIVGWGVAGGYKDWALHKRKKEKMKLSAQELAPFNYERYSEKDEYE